MQYADEEVNSPIGEARILFGGAERAAKLGAEQGENAGSNVAHSDAWEAAQQAWTDAFCTAFEKEAGRRPTQQEAQRSFDNEYIDFLEGSGRWGDRPRCTWFDEDGEPMDIQDGREKYIETPQLNIKREEVNGHAD